MSKVSDMYDEVAKGYDEFYSDKQSLSENTIIKQLLKPHIGSRTMVLDLGCGTGLLYDMFEGNLVRYIGFDISSEMIKVFREKHPRAKLFNAPADTLSAIIPSDFVVSLFSSPSYFKKETIVRIKESKCSYFLMFYKKGYRGKIIKDSDKSGIKYVDHRKIFSEDEITLFLDWEIVTNLW